MKEIKILNNELVEVPFTRRGKEVEIWDSLAYSYRVLKRGREVYILVSLPSDDVSRFEEVAMKPDVYIEFLELNAEEEAAFRDAMKSLVRRKVRRLSFYV